MIAHWKFNQVAGDTIIDSTDNGLDGKLIGKAKIIDDPGRRKVLALDGNGSYVDCGNDWRFDISGAITVSAWVKVGKYDGSNIYLYVDGALDGSKKASGHMRAHNLPVYVGGRV